MVGRVAEQADKTGATRIVVAADRDDVLAIFRAHGVELVMTCTDHIRDTDRMVQIAQDRDLRNNKIVVNLQSEWSRWH